MKNAVRSNFENKKDVLEAEGFQAKPSYKLDVSYSDTGRKSPLRARIEPGECITGEINCKRVERKITNSNGVSEQAAPEVSRGQDENNSGVAKVSSYTRGKTEISGRAFRGPQSSKSEQEAQLKGFA